MRASAASYHAVLRYVVIAFADMLPQHIAATRVR